MLPAVYILQSMKCIDRPGVRLPLKVPVLKAGLIETLLYGCTTWSPPKAHYDKLRHAQHSLCSFKASADGKGTRDNHLLLFCSIVLPSLFISIFRGKLWPHPL